MLGNINKAADLVLGGWQLNTVVSWQSGVHRSVSSTNLTGLSYVTQRADAKGIDPFTSFNGITPREDFSGDNKSLYWFNPTAFSATLPLKFGTSGRDIITAPAWWNTDLSAFKTFNITERTNIQFRAEAFNAFNNVQFNPPEMSVVSPNFARLTSALRPRVMQMALRFTF
jgi:hypothetical protein